MSNSNCRNCASSYGAFGNLQESKKFPVPNCVTSNKASNFFGNFWKFPRIYKSSLFLTVSLVIGLLTFLEISGKLF